MQQYHNKLAPTYTLSLYHITLKYGASHPMFHMVNALIPTTRTHKWKSPLKTLLRKKCVHHLIQKKKKQKINQSITLYTHLNYYFHCPMGIMGFKIVETVGVEFDQTLKL